MKSLEPDHPGFCCPSQPLIAAASVLQHIGEQQAAAVMLQARQAK